MIRLEFSDKNVPFINLEEYGRLAFSTLTAHPIKGYRFICYSRCYEDQIRIKKKYKGEVIERYYRTEGRDSTVLDMEFQRKIGQQTKGFQRGTIPPRLGEWIRKIFKKFITEDKYFPYEQIEPLRKYLARQDVDKILSKPQRKRKVKNGRKTKIKRDKGNTKTRKGINAD